MDGFLPKADENLMQWVLNDSKGFPYWHERSIYRLVPNYPLLDLLAERDSDKNRSDIYIAEISDTQSIEFMRGLSRYNLIDEMVVYTLPLILGKGTPVFDDLTPSRWNVHKTTTFPAFCNSRLRKSLAFCNTLKSPDFYAENFYFTDTQCCIGVFLCHFMSLARQMPFR